MKNREDHFFSCEPPSLFDWLAYDAKPKETKANTLGQNSILYWDSWN
jgi:hypothetical protein